MKYVVKVDDIAVLPDTRPLVAMDNNGNCGWRPAPTPGPANDEIWYTSSDGQVVTPYETSALPSIVSNTYSDGKGVIKFESDVTSIGQGAFAACTSLASITIPNSVASIGYSAFYQCTGLNSVTIPNSVTSIGAFAFQQTSLTSMNFPNSVSIIEQASFYDCNSLISVTFGNGITSIGNGTFSSCNSLTSISYTGTVEQWNSITKGSAWHADVPATVVHCTDGDVNI